MTIQVRSQRGNRPVGNPDPVTPKPRPIPMSRQFNVVASRLSFRRSRTVATQALLQANRRPGGNPDPITPQPRPPQPLTQWLSQKISRSYTFS